MYQNGVCGEETWADTVSLAAVLSLVTQRSSPQRAAHIRTTLLPLCSLCTNEINDIASDVTNQSTGNCNQHHFSYAFSNSAFDRSFLMEEMPKKVLQSDRCFICSTSVQEKDKIHIFQKSSFNFLAIISSCLDVNVSWYSATSELSVCKACCRPLISSKRPLIILKSSKMN